MLTRTATRSCPTRKRAFHFYSPGVVRRSHTAARARCGTSRTTRAGTVVCPPLLHQHSALLLPPPPLAAAAGAAV